MSDDVNVTTEVVDEYQQTTEVVDEYQQKVQLTGEHSKEGIEDIVNALISAGANIDVTYDDGVPTLTIKTEDIFTFDETSTPSKSSLGEGIIHFDDTDHIFSVSENNDEFAPLMGTRRLNTNLTEQTITETAEETTMAITTLAGNRLREHNIVAGTMNFNNFDIAKGDSITFRFYYGGVLVTSGTLTNGTNANITGHSGKFQVTLIANGSTSSQEGFISVQMGGGNYAPSSSAGTTAFMNESGATSVDSTNVNDLKVTAQWDTADSGNSLSKDNAYIQLIQ